MDTKQFEDKNLFELYEGLLQHFGVKDKEDALAQLKADWLTYSRFISNLAILKEDWDTFERFNKNLTKLLGKPDEKFDVQEYLKKQVDEGESRTNKILNILKEANMPLKAKIIKDIYINRQMERGSLIQIKRGIQSTLAGMKKANKIAVDENDRYYIENGKNVKIDPLSDL